MDEAVGRDLDETRRLLYMALAASKTDRYNLAGTLVNALAHHGPGVDPVVAMQKVLDAIDGGDEGKAWAEALITQITAEMTP